MNSLIFAATVALPLLAFLRGRQWQLALLILVPASWALYALWVWLRVHLPDIAYEVSPIHETWFAIPRERVLTRVALAFCLFPATYLLLRWMRALRFGRNMALTVLTQHAVFAALEIDMRHILRGAPGGEAALYWSTRMEQSLAVIAGIALTLFAALTLLQLALRLLRGPAS